MAVTFGYVDSSAGARICYAAEPGSGVPVLQLSQTAFPGASILSRYEGSLATARGLAGGASWYQWDMRGAGRSTVPPGPVTFDQLVDDAEAVAEEIGEPFDLFAVNDCCRVALGLAVRRPELVRRLLLVSPDAAGVLPEPELQAYLATGERLMGLWQFIMWVHPGADPGDCRAMAEEHIAAQPPEAIVSLRRAAISADARALGRQVAAPALLISTGDGLAETLAIAACMPAARTANWTHIGDGTINGPAWRRAWDEHVPPETLVAPPGPRRGEGILAASAAAFLSVREVDVLRLIAAGRTNREIAAALVLADGTVSRHVHNILTKLDLPNRSAAATWAATHGVAPAAF